LSESGTNGSDWSHRKIKIKGRDNSKVRLLKKKMSNYLWQWNFIKLKLHLEKGNYFLQKLEIELIQVSQTEWVN